MANDTTRTLDRRSFLRGSALFAGAIGLSAIASEAGTRPRMQGASSVPPRQGNEQKPKPKPEEKTKPEPEDPFAEGEKPKDGKLIDKEGREYKICPQCGYNMYKQGRMWICENCGYSYVE
jgi:ribosomal protein S27AE